jgi:HPt (histidine-containing phosphotransfer) domain-containing protein
MMGASAQPAEPPVIEKPVGTPPEPQDRTLAQRAADELGRLKSERVSAKDEAESDSAASPGRGAESDRPAKAARPEAGEGRKPSSKRAPDDLVVLGPEQIEPDASGESGSKPAAEPTTAEPVATKESAPAKSEPAASKSEPAPAKSEPPAPKREAAPVAAHSADAAPPPSAAPASTPPAAPQLPVNPGIVDESVPVIDEIRFDASSMGRPELRQVLAKTFLKHARKRIIRIEEMLLASDAQGVEFEAHGMKGMCLTLGAARCVKLFHDMELLARAGELDSLKPVLKRLKMETERVEAHLSKFDQAA